MIKSITLRNFKSFRDATLKFGGFTLLVGTNASGKSNVRDALRFLHGISRGYSLAEIIGEKWIEGGVLQWKGIRGGLREVCRKNGGENRAFTVAASLQLASGKTADYSITVAAGENGKPATVAAESLKIPGRGQYVFDTHPGGEGIPSEAPHQIMARMRKLSKKGFLGPQCGFRIDQPILSQIADHPGTSKLTVREDCRSVVDALSGFRFLDLDVNALRKPSTPGQEVLSDKGENLSSVLAGICEDDATKQALIEWTKELTPLDVTDIKFPQASLGGDIQLQVVEAGGREISAESTSDGTLRFLAYLAAFLGRKPADFYFFEELENGIHPNRLHLLISLIRQRTHEAGIQIVGTTHSPALLDFLDDDSLQSASIIYRSGDESRIMSFADIPDLWTLANRHAGGLHAAGWFETVLNYIEAAKVVS